MSAKESSASSATLKQQSQSNSTFLSLHKLSRLPLALLLLTYITAAHLTALYHFSNGFLLTRVTSLDKTPPYGDANPRTLEPTHKKAIVVIIDALRSDYIHPIPPSSEVYNQYYHNQLTLPAELAQKYPQNSLLLEMYSDPPTTTMQRLKALTTGSLPTFIDAGSNFASTEILEDTLISQWKAAGKQVGMLGDDTWLGLFPLSSGDVNATEEKYWKRELVHGFDSFNVEDLHSVDDGVINNFFPILANENKTASNEWDILILHFLGVDHVGHRVGLSSPLMKTKLQQMDAFLTRTVEEMDDDTLLLVMGDHGADQKGDHGGDGPGETSAAGWFYSKGKKLTLSSSKYAPANLFAKLGHLLGDIKFPQTKKVNQIDLVSTLSFMLGTPIPYNNLGSVIPDLLIGTHEEADNLERIHLATTLNADQINTYLSSYPGSTLNPYRRALNEARESAINSRKAIQNVLASSGSTDQQMRDSRLQAILAEREFVDLSLNILRGLWAQFSRRSMLLGIGILGLSIPAIWSLYLGVVNTRAGWNIYVREVLLVAIKIGGFVGSVIGTGRGAYTRIPLEAIAWAWTGSMIGSLAAISVIGIPAMIRTSILFLTRFSLMQLVAPGLTFLYAIAFAANSFIIWEDRMSSFMLATLLILPALKAMTAPTHRLRLRILGFSILATVLSRLISISTVCREEQGAHCRVTFYAGETYPIAPALILAMTLPLAWYLPKLIGMVLDESKSNSGPAPFFLSGVRAALTLGATYWILEYAEHWDGMNPDRIPLVKVLKLWVARAAMGLIMGAGGVVWKGMPLCIEIKREEQVAAVIGEAKSDTPQVTVYGFANAFGSSYLLFVLLGFGILFLVNQSTGQVVLVASLFIVLLHLETTDAMRDSRAMASAFASSSSPGEFEGVASTLQQAPRFRETTVLVLLSHVLFFTTGHQAGFTAIQWKAAFVGLSTVSYPLSPLLVILNTFGGYILMALTVPLLALWNVSPTPQGRSPILADTLQAGLAFILHFSLVTFTNAFFSGWLRRHLMVWKVFAPRFMMAGTTLVVVELTLILAIGLGVGGVVKKVARTFKTESV